MTQPVLIAAGGTGGHLFPARALAEELARRDVPVHLVTDERGRIFDADFPAQVVHAVPAATPVGRSAVKAAGAIWTLTRGIAAARRLIRAIRPQVVTGFGGYPTVPPLVAARLAGVPVLIHEQNAVVGRANRLLARLATTVALSVPEPANASRSLIAKSVVTGNPVRDSVVAARAIAYPPAEPDGPFRVLVFGGSQGAHIFAEVVPGAIGELEPAARRRLVLTQQCRPEDLVEVRTKFEELSVTAELESFFRDMPERIAAAHLVIARSGASTATELAVIGRPSILVPLPHAIDNDQLANARALAKAGAAILMEQRDLDCERLAREIRSLMEAPARLSAMAEAAHRAGTPDAVRRLADVVVKLGTG